MASTRLETMKVIARHQLYLDYLLPRSSDWPDLPIKFIYLDVEVNVRPKLFDEPLFPENIDKILFEMKVPFTKAKPFASGSGFFHVREKCLDRIEVDVHLPVESNEEALLEEIHDQALNAAIDAANVFLSHCRVAARDSYIRGIERHYCLETGKFHTLNPRTVSWHDGETGESIPAYENGQFSMAHSGARPLVVTKPVSIHKIATSIKSSEDPLLPISLLADATWQLRTFNLRETLLLIGIACEVAGHHYVNQFNHSSSTYLDKIAPSHFSFAEKWFHLIPNHFQGRSFQKSFSIQFEEVKRMYWSRNNVAHEGRAYYRDPEENSEIPVTQELATKFLSASQDAIDWLLGVGKFSTMDDA